jgi:hypothetical protein
MINLTWLYPDFWNFSVWLVMWSIGWYLAYNFIYKASKRYPGLIKKKASISLMAFVASFTVGFIYFLANFNIIVYYLLMTIAPSLSLRRAYKDNQRRELENKLD